MAGELTQISEARKKATIDAARDALDTYKEALEAAKDGMQEKAQMDDMKRTNARLGDAGQLGQ